MIETIANFILNIVYSYTIQMFLFFFRVESILCIILLFVSLNRLLSFFVFLYDLLSEMNKSAIINAIMYITCCYLIAFFSSHIFARVSKKAFIDKMIVATSNCINNKTSILISKPQSVINLCYRMDSKMSTIADF